MRPTRWLAAIAILATQACTNDLTPVAPPTNPLHPRSRTNDIQPAAFGDPFDGTSVDPFWTVRQQYATVSLSGDQAHSGSQSIALTGLSAPSNSGPNASITHTFAAPTKGTFSVYFYDLAPGQQTLYEQINLYSTSQPGLLAAIGTNDFDAFCYMSRLDDGHGGTQGPNANCGAFPSTQTTPVHRTQGWHLLTIDVRADGVAFAIDGQQTFIAAGDYSFDQVQIFVGGPYWRPLTTGYFDDFNFLPLTPANRAPTAVPGTAYAGAEGSAVSFDGSASTDPDGDALQYSWDFGDGSTGAGARTTHTYADNGTYTATLSVNDGHGGSDTKPVTVTIINVPPTVTGFSIPSQVTFSGGAGFVQVTAVTYSDPAGALDEPVIISIDCGNETTADASKTCAYSAIGRYTISVRATDKDGGASAAVSLGVAVVYPFGGFFAPVQNLPTLNTVKAGSAIPIKFTLGGDYGLGVIAAGYPVVQTIACSTNAPTNDVEETVTAGNSALSYDATTGIYTYVWKTDKAWTGTCQRLTVKLIDGSSHDAIFSLTK